MTTVCTWKQRSFAQLKGNICSDSNNIFQRSNCFRNTWNHKRANKRIALLKLHFIPPTDLNQLNR